MYCDEKKLTAIEMTSYLHEAIPVQTHTLLLFRSCNKLLKPNLFC